MSNRPNTDPIFFPIATSFRSFRIFLPQSLESNRGSFSAILLYLSPALQPSNCSSSLMISSVSSEVHSFLACASLFEGSAAAGFLSFVMATPSVICSCFCNFTKCFASATVLNRLPKGDIYSRMETPCGVWRISRVHSSPIFMACSDLIRLAGGWEICWSSDFPPLAALLPLSFSTLAALLPFDFSALEALLLGFSVFAALLPLGVSTLAALSHLRFLPFPATGIIGSGDFFSSLVNNPSQSSGRFTSDSLVFTPLARTTEAS
mmetsp:Transcript_7548/g.13731  ORF Transcript_7548/g.13731 Transcript_7548/m.13731 type:complete len:263 (+) Transcript_7548:1048-1836(+)